ncbi:hypothetical protein MMC06_002743 [Schaereria dolodes]|nr:hypothetical protein [Schaereria dolodes]
MVDQEHDMISDEELIGQMGIRKPMSINAEEPELEISRNVSKDSETADHNNDSNKSNERTEAPGTDQVSKGSLSILNDHTLFQMLSEASTDPSRNGEPYPPQRLPSPVPLEIAVDALVRGLQDEESRKRHTRTLLSDEKQNCKVVHTKARYNAYKGQPSAKSVSRNRDPPEVNPVQTGNKAHQTTFQPSNPRMRASDCLYPEHRSACEPRSTTSQFQCHKCDKNFKQRNGLMRHLTRGTCSDSYGTQTYACRLCSKSFTTPGGLTYHARYGKCKKASSLPSSSIAALDLAGSSSDRPKTCYATYANNGRQGPSQHENALGFALLASSPSLLDRDVKGAPTIPLLKKRDHTQRNARRKELRRQEREKRQALVHRYAPIPNVGTYAATIALSDQEIDFPSTESCSEARNINKIFCKRIGEGSSRRQLKLDDYEANIKAALSKFEDLNAVHRERKEANLKASKDDMLFCNDDDSADTSDQDEAQDRDQIAKYQQRALSVSNAVATEPNNPMHDEFHIKYAGKKLPDKAASKDFQITSQNSADVKRDEDCYRVEEGYVQEEEDELEDMFWSYHVTGRQWLPDDPDGEPRESSCGSHFTVEEANEVAQQRSMQFLGDLEALIGTSITCTLGRHMMQTWHISSESVYVQFTVSRTIRSNGRLPQSIKDALKKPVEIFIVFEKCLGEVDRSLTPQTSLGTFYTLDLANRAAGKAWYARETGGLGASELDGVRKAEVGMHLYRDLGRLEQDDGLFDRVVMDAEGRDVARVWVEVHRVVGPRN